MRSFFLHTALLFFVQLALAQKRVEGLIQAEKNFAAWSVSHNTKEAFLQFLDSNGVIFDNGKPVNGIDTWNKREKRPGILNWRPLSAEIAASNDLGYTSGPWTFRLSLNDSIVARGYYTTVWRKNKNGEWKFLVDLGVQNTPEEKDTSSCSNLSLLQSDPASYHSDLGSLIKTEKNFIKRTSEISSKGWSRKEWYKRNYSGNMRLSRNGRLPARDTDPFLSIMTEMNFPIKYSIIGWGIASSGDLGYVYGTTVIKGKTDGYLRIWRRERDGWKIALEVLRY